MEREPDSGTCRACSLALIEEFLVGTGQQVGTFGLVAEQAAGEGEPLEVFGAECGIARRGVQLTVGAAPGLSFEGGAALLEGVSGRHRPLLHGAARFLSPRSLVE